LRNNKASALLITFREEDVEAANYADDIAEAFNRGGWVVSGPVPVAGSPAAGVLLEMDDFRSPRPGSALLIDVLAAVGINARVTLVTYAGPTHYRLMIGADADYVPRPVAA
jgi:hypothetical protein